MNQKGLVELDHIIDGNVYRALLPMGVPYAQARQALLEMASAIEEFVKQQEELAKSQQEAQLPEDKANEPDDVHDWQAVPNSAYDSVATDPVEAEVISE